MGAAVISLSSVERRLPGRRNRTNCCKSGRTKLHVEKTEMGCGGFAGKTAPACVRTIRRTMCASVRDRGGRLPFTRFPRIPICKTT